MEPKEKPVYGSNGITKHASRGYVVAVSRNCEYDLLTVLRHDGMFVHMDTGEREQRVAAEWNKKYPADTLAVDTVPMPETAFPLPTRNGETIAMHFSGYDKVSEYLASILLGDDYKDAVDRLSKNGNAGKSIDDCFD